MDEEKRRKKVKKMNFKTYLEEGRDAPLYHGTSLAAAHKIFMDDELKSKKDGYNKGTLSFSRSKYHAQSVATTIIGSPRIVVFEIDQRKLAQRYKIVPYVNPTISPIHNKRPMYNQSKLKKSHSFIGNNEFEEVVKSPIKNFMSYVTQIYIKKNVMDYLNDREEIHILELTGLLKIE